jgi:DNA-binding Lrp family transcriptional regulator
MISKKDSEIISHLRNNAREKVTSISKKTNIPVTTIYDKIRVHEKRFLKKHISLLNFQNIGLNAKSQVAIAVERESRDALQKYLMENMNVNSLAKINFGYDFLAEVVFKDAGEVQNFTESLEKNYKISRLHIFNVIEELKKEAFLTKPEHVSLIL